MVRLQKRRQRLDNGSKAPSKTAPVRLGRDVTIGLGSVIDIGVTVGPRSQVGALSLVPKYTTLDADAVYAGIPVRRLDSKQTIEI